KGLVLQQLYYPNEIRSIDEIELTDAPVKDNELKMAIQLAEMGASDEFHPENYRDEQTEKTRAMIQRKIDGEEITSLDTQEPRAQVIDLMEALRASLGGSRPAAAPTRSASTKTNGKIPIRADQKRKPAKPAVRKAAAAAKSKAR